MRSLSLTVLALLLTGSAMARSSSATHERLVACGWGNLSIFELHPGTADPIRESWFWKPQDDEGVPEMVDDLYRHIDECKPLDREGNRILITASTDGVGIVDRQARRFIHIGVARNAHSADVLPGGRIAVAASHGGDSLIIFEGKADARVLITKPLPGGHGVHWDAQAKRLYALSNDAIELYELVAWDSDRPDLRHLRTIRLPETEGHELSRIAGTSLFHLTTATKAWIFDSALDRLTAHPALVDKDRIKAISTNSATGHIAWMQADPGGWWSYNLRFVGKGLPATIPVNKRYYKLRWIDPGRP